jgi:hypothetical protein
MWYRAFVYAIGRVTIGTALGLAAGTFGIYVAWWFVNRGPQVVGVLSQFAG